MKKSLVNLALLLVVALGLILLLVKRSDPDKKRIGFKRDYNRYTIMPAGMIQFPGKVSLVKIVQGNVYGYVHKAGTVYKYGLAGSRLDTFIHFARLGVGALNGFDIDPVLPIFYGFTTQGRQIMHFGRDGGLTGTIGCKDNPYVKGIKGFGVNSFFIQAYDSSRVISLLKLARYSDRHTDTVIYQFPHFDDGGISEDGFFIKQPVTGDLYFIPFYNASIIRFNEAKNRVSGITTIDSTRPANIAIHTSLGYMISSKAILLNSAAASDSDNLYVLSYALDGTSVAPQTGAGISLPGAGRKKVAIDIYSTKDGNYEGSLSLDAPPSGAVLSLDKSGDTLFVSSTNNILLYKLARNRP